MGTSDLMISRRVAELGWEPGTLSSGRLKICSKDTRACSDSSTLRCSRGSSSQNRLWALVEGGGHVGAPSCVLHSIPCLAAHYTPCEELSHIQKTRSSGLISQMEICHKTVQARSPFLQRLFPGGLLCSSHCAGHCA